MRIAEHGAGEVKSAWRVLIVGGAGEVKSAWRHYRWRRTA